MCAQNALENLQPTTKTTTTTTTTVSQPANGKAATGQRDGRRDDEQQKTTLVVVAAADVVVVVVVSVALAHVPQLQPIQFVQHSQTHTHTAGYSKNTLKHLAHLCESRLAMVSQ